MSDDTANDKGPAEKPIPPGGRERADAPDKNPTDTETSGSADPQEKPPDPTRFGDWEKNGRCIDF